MNVLISPNAFKGTMTAREAGGIIEEFFKSKFPQVNTQLLPIADGGDGTCDLLSEVLGLQKNRKWALNAVGRPTPCFFGLDRQAHKAYIDVSMASGIGLLDRGLVNPYVTSSYGTGMLIRRAIDLGAQEIILGLGGSATVDLGIGILAPLGILFLDKNGRELTQFSPNFLSNIRHIQKSIHLPKVRFLCLCDVKNTFFGERGAIPIFGPQKGVLPEQISSFESDCEKVVKLLAEKQKKDFEDKPGFGAAGGIALGLSFFFETEIRFGSNYFFEKVKLEEKVKWADLIITGEGKYDSQSSDGKACFEIMQLAASQSKKIVLITTGKEIEFAAFDQVLTLPELDFSKSDYKKKSRENLRSLLESDLSLVY